MERVLELSEELAQKEEEIQEIKMQNQAFQEELQQMKVHQEEQVRALKEELRRERELRLAAERRAGQGSSSSSSFGA
jgi:hypothetical protein